MIWLLLIFLAAAGLRLAGPYLQETFFAHRQFLISGPELYGHYKSDELVYNFTAKSILEGRGISLKADEVVATEKGYYDEKLVRFLDETYRLRGKQDKTDPGYWHHNLIPPLYSAFLALVYFLFGVKTLAYFIPQVILGALTCLIIYFIAQELFDDKVAMVACLAAAFYPELVLWSYMIRPEILYIFLLTAGLLLVIKGNKYSNIFLIVAGGTILGLASLTRITLLLFFPLLVIWQFWFAEKKKMILTAVLLLSLLLVLVPWAVRNYIVFNEFTFFTNEVSVVLVDHMPLEKIENSRSPSAFLGQFYNYFIGDPGGYFYHSLGRLVTYLSPFTPGMDKFAKIYKFIGWLVIFPAGFIGIVLSVLKAWRRSSLLILFIAYYIAVHSATCVDIGLVYRYPIIPLMGIFAAYAYVSFISWYLSNKKIGAAG
ncbi:MAG: glycosyltransferase family 39 protein [Candidatus Margulisbacteria bacterium]|nr:glycosyltransferase family 39 protein [Candidatus Margulisiibacteriota bacterium]